MISIYAFYLNFYHFLGLLKHHVNLDQQMALDADGHESYRLKPYPIKARNHVKTFTSDEFERRFTHADFSAQKLVIYSQRD